jgi:hypothetical protein
MELGLDFRDVSAACLHIAHCAFASMGSKVKKATMKRIKDIL